MPDSLDSVSTASEEGGSRCCSHSTEESLYTPSPDTIILDHHDLDSDEITTMSCLTTPRRKSARDLNNRWVLLNKDTFQEILNDTLNQMTTGVEPAEDAVDRDGGDNNNQRVAALDCSSHSPSGPAMSPRGSCDHVVLEPTRTGSPSQRSNKKNTGQTNKTSRAKGSQSSSSTQVSHSKAGDKGDKTGTAKKSNVPTTGGRKHMASNRTIIASSAFKKHELRVVSRINFKDAVDRAEKVKLAAQTSGGSDPQPPNTGSATTATTTTATAAPAPRKHSASKRSKVVCKAPNKAAPGDLAGSRGGMADSVRRGGSSVAHGTQLAVSNAGPVHRPTHSRKDAKDAQQSSTAAQPDKMSVAAVAASPPPSGSTSSASTSSNPSNTAAGKMKVPVPEERCSWVKVSKSTLFDLVEELVARRLGEDSPVTSDVNNDDNKNRKSDTVSDKDTVDTVDKAGTSKSANKPATSGNTNQILSDTKPSDGANVNNNNAVSANASANANANTGTNKTVSKDMSATTTDHNEHNDSTGNEPSKVGSVGWVALNKTVVIDMVDEAIMRQLEDDNDDDNDDNNDDNNGESTGAGSGSDSNRRNLEPAAQGARRRRSVETCTQVDLLPGSAADGSRPSVTAIQCPQAKRTGSPPTNTRPTQPPKPISGTSCLDSEVLNPGQLASKSKKRVLECMEESANSSSSTATKRKKADLGPCLVSTRLSEIPASVAAVAAASTNVQKAISLVAGRDPLLTAAILSAHRQTAAAAAAAAAANVDLRNVYAPSDPMAMLAFASSAQASICSAEKAMSRGGQARSSEFSCRDTALSSADKSPLANRQCNIIDLRAKILPGDATVPAISHFPPRTLANQCAPTDSANNDALGIQLDGRNNTDRANGSSETVSANKRDTKNARDSPETTWVAVSKSDVNSIVDCVVNTMINDDDAVTSPARADDSSTRSVTPRSTSSTSDDDDDIAAENVPPPANSQQCVSAQVFANRQMGSDSGSERDSPQSKTMTVSGPRPQSLAPDNWCNRLENLPNRPPSRTMSPPSHVKENVSDSSYDKLEEAGMAEVLAEDCDGEPKKAFKWKSTLMKRVREESGSKTGGRGSPALPGRGRSQSDPGIKTVVSSAKDSSKQDRRCSKRVTNTSGKRRQHRQVLTAT